MRLGRHRRRGRFARTNRPERFVGNGDSCKLLARKHAHAVAKLLSDHVSRVLLFEFSYANNRYETGLQRGQNLLRYAFICFAKILAPVAVAHNHMRTARCPNHRTRNLSGVGSFFCPVQVLNANLYPGPAGGADRCFEAQKRWTDHDLAVYRRFDQWPESFEEDRSRGCVLCIFQFPRNSGE